MPTPPSSPEMVIDRQLFPSLAPGIPPLTVDMDQVDPFDWFATQADDAMAYDTPPHSSADMTSVPFSHRDIGGLSVSPEETSSGQSHEV
jgi:hypothetical protein